MPPVKTYKEYKIENKHQVLHTVDRSRHHLDSLIWSITKLGMMKIWQILLKGHLSRTAKEVSLYEHAHC